MRSRELPPINARRTWLVRIALVAAFVALAGQAWRLQVTESGAYREQAEINRVRVSTISPLRGVIYDRQGRLMAANAPSFVVAVVPADLPRDREETVLQRLGVILGAEPAPMAEVLQRARASGDVFTPAVVRRSVSANTIPFIAPPPSQANAPVAARCHCHSMSGRFLPVMARPLPCVPHNTG